MAEVSSAGDNEVQRLVDNKCKSSDIACIKCEELENKLQETLLELGSVELIIKLLQKEIDTITAAACMTIPNILDSIWNMKYLMIMTGSQPHLVILTNWETLQSTLKNMKNGLSDNILELLTALRH